RPLPDPTAKRPRPRLDFEPRPLAFIEATGFAGGRLPERSSSLLCYVHRRSRWLSLPSLAQLNKRRLLLRTPQLSAGRVDAASLTALELHLHAPWVTDRAKGLPSFRRWRAVGLARHGIERNEVPERVAACQQPVEQAGMFGTVVEIG